MNAGRVAVKVWLGVVLAISALVTIALVTVIVIGPEEHPDPELRNEGPAAVARWCDDIAEGFAPNGPFDGFEEAARAAIAGELRRPAEDPPTEDVEALDRWQEEHAAYVSTHYLTLLESTPAEATYAGTAFDLMVEAAHEGEAIDDPDLLLEAARSLDRRRRRSC